VQEVGEDKFRPAYAEKAEENVEIATVVYMGAQKCYVSLEREVKEGIYRPRLSFVSTKLLKSERLIVGDSVRVRCDKEYTRDMPGTVVQVASRRNVFQRVDSDGKPKLLASNLDQVIVCSSFGNPPFSSFVVDSVLSAACLSSIPAVVVLNKVDLCEHSKFDDIKSTYERSGFRIIGTSAKERLGINELHKLLSGKTSVLYGLSGAGKSSLLNALADLDISTRPVSQALRSGRHTTSSSVLYRLDAQTCVVDTPGVRSFRPMAGKNRLVEGFPDILAKAERCAAGRRCSHIHESVEDCFVMQSVADGSLPQSRYTSYAHLYFEQTS